MPNNNRIAFNMLQAGFAQDGSTTYTAVHGVQSVGMSTNYNLDTFFELGQLEIYANLEQIPDVEVSIEKILDGYPLLWHLATKGATVGSLIGRSNVKTAFGLSLFSDTLAATSGNPIAELNCSGMYPSQSSFSFDLDAAFTENITLIGSNRIWKTSSYTFTGAFAPNNDTPLASASGLGSVNRRQHLVLNPPSAMALDSNSQINAGPGSNRCTVLPPDIPGITSSGTNPQNADGSYTTHLRSINVSANLGREAIFELGRRSPYCRYVTFPVPVTCDIEVTAHTGDLLSATEEGSLGNGNNLTTRTIKVATTEGTFIDLGVNNKLTSITYGGGDTGGANLTTTFSYQGYNKYLVCHLQEALTA